MKKFIVNKTMKMGIQSWFTQSIVLNSSKGDQFIQFVVKRKINQ